MASADRLIEVFNEAKARPVGAAREQFLIEACRDEPALKAQVLALLHAHDIAGDFLKPLQLSSTGLPTEKPGDRIGRYKLLQEIGEGGCGVVYMAEQEEPVRRRVALKIIKPGMDSKSVIARFEAERQALAMMDHPNIAKILDAGATETGRPFFVMELVRGVRITEFCDESRLPTTARLRLFVQVCRAVQHAHQKGIIHRDLKPSNILVTINDGVPVPKIIDFGIAKATGQRLTDKTVFTQFQSFIGTPAYTSPEQAEMSSVDIDTRSDIYSLGVLLYELLTGRTPFDSEVLLRSGLDEMRRTIRETEPCRPSVRLNALELVEATALSGKRKASIPELTGAVQGDLDWIVMKCLEKDRARRYETANGLAMDIQRHLNREPVIARPPSRMYLLQKMAQRHRGAWFAAATALGALLVALIVLAVSNARIRHERDQKDQALEERAVALEAARGSEQRAREQLFGSLQNLALAKRSSGQMGQRMESLAALAEAAHMRPTPELRDSAVAAMAMPDIQLGTAWRGWEGELKGFAYDSLRNRYARMEVGGLVSVRTLPDNRELQRLQSSPKTPGDTNRCQLTFSPDGKFLAWFEAGGGAEVWRWETGGSVLQDSPDKCATLAFSPDSKQIAVGYDSGITCYDLSSGRKSSQWPTRDHSFRIAFHPDSQRLAVGYERMKVVSVYHAADGRLLLELPLSNSGRTIVAWHPDGKFLAIAGQTTDIQIWDVEARRMIARLEGHVEPVTFLSFEAGGDLLNSLATDGVSRLWQPSPGRLLMQLPISECIGFSTAGKWSGVISPSNHLAQPWGIVPSQEYHTFLNPFGDGECILLEGDISRDGRLLALGTSDGVRIWDVGRGRQVAWLRLHETTTTLFGANGNELLTCGQTDGLQRWHFETNPSPGGDMQLETPHPISLPFAPRRIARGREDWTLAIVGEAAGQVMLLDLKNESPALIGMPHTRASFLALSPDGAKLATSSWHNDMVRLWDGRNGKLLKELKAGLMSRVFIAPDNRELIIARAQELTFHDLKTMAVSRQLPRVVGLYPGYVAFTSEGGMMAWEVSPGIINLTETSSGRTIAKLEDPQGDVSTWMGFSPDGTQLIVVSKYAGAIHRWDLRAIRERLKGMNLDWDWPEFLPVPTKLDSSDRRDTAK